MAQIKISNIERIQKAIQKENAKLGLTFKKTKVLVKDANGNPVKDKDGNPVTRTVNELAHINDDARELMEVFQMGTPCWFKGCQALRDQYNEEKKQSNCKACSGTLLRKYMQLARHLLDADPERVVPDLH